MTDDEYNEKCSEHYCLLYCYKDPQYYIICVFFLILFIFYFCMFISSIISFIRTKSYKKISETWAQPTFWFCLLINPIIEFLFYFKYISESTNFFVIIFFVLNNFSNIFPYITVCLVVIQFGISINPSASKNKEKRNMIICFTVFFALFLACFIIQVFNVPFFIQIQDILLLVTRFISFLIYIIVAVSFLNEMKSVEIHYLPKNFLTKLFIGIHVIAILNFIHTLLNAFWWGYQDCCGLSFQALIIEFGNIFLIFQMIIDSFSACSNLLLAVGIIYINHIPKQIEQYQD